jgi:hypothetical protein
MIRAEEATMKTKIAEILVNLSKVAARASVENEPLVTLLARETLAIAEVLQKIVEGNAAAKLNPPPPSRPGG